jgi:penicillin-binding protein 2B
MSSPSPLKTHKRTNITLLVWFSIFFLIISVISANVFVVVIGGKHVYSQTDIKEIANQVYIKKENILASRGLIVDADHNVLAEDVITYKIILYLDESRKGVNNKPAYVVDINATAQALAPILDMEEHAILQLLNQDLYQTELGVKGKNLSLNQKNEIMALDLPGIEFQTMVSRNYPYGEFASHLIGFAQYDDASKSNTGRMGIEANFNTMLTGQNGYRHYQSDISGFHYKDMYNQQEDAVDGNTVVLTLDRRIQETLELAIKQTQENVNAYQTWALVMEVDTGRILAWGQTPGFDPNTMNIDDYDNVISQGVFEPGSTMKSFVYATAIDKGRYNGQATYASGAFHMGVSNGLPIQVASASQASTTIYNANRRDWGIVNFDRAFSVSLNTAIATLLTNNISVRDYEQYMDRFGFFKKTDIVGVLENNGVKAFRYPIEMITSGYGQGSSMTTLQLMQAYSAIFNDGVMVKPKIVDAILDGKTGLTLQEFPTEIVSMPIQASTAKEVQRLMTTTAKEGTARYYGIPDVSIMGKTGTAHLIGPNGYYKDRTLNSVVIGLPADQPKISVFYGFIAPGGITPARENEPIKTLLRKIAMVYHLSDQGPDDEDVEAVETQVLDMPHFINQKVSLFEQFALEHAMHYTLLGDGDRIIETSFDGLDKLLNTSHVFIKTNQPLTTMVDLKGLSKKEVQMFAQLSQLELEIEGEGWVIEQSLAAHETLDGETISVVCSLNPPDF